MIRIRLFNIGNNLSGKLKRNFSNNGKGAKLCIVGGGPAGFYAASRIIKLLPDATVDIYEKLPVPFGLVRYGVAPDHPEVKNVINTFTKTAKSPNVNFYGNVTLGKDINISHLQLSYHAILLTYGAEEDRKLNIPGEDLENVISARRFVGWYNGVPADKDLKVNLDDESVVIIGQGNVGIDVARILLSPVDDLRKTDITEYSLERLAMSSVKKVSLVGRRGPLQVAFTIKELREMLKLPGVNTLFRREDFNGIEKVIPELARPRKRLTELLYKTAMDKVSTGNKIFEIVFKRTPLRFHGKESVSGVELAVNNLVGEDIKSQKAVATDEKYMLQCGLALRSIGYKSLQAEPFIPFDAKKGTTVNENGRIAPGLYCSGWLSTGPLGVILSTMQNAFSTAHMLYEDINQNILPINDIKPGSDFILDFLNKKGVQVVSFEDWEKIDKEEERRGKAMGKIREKIVSVEEMLSFAR